MHRSAILAAALFLAVTKVLAQQPATLEPNPAPSMPQATKAVAPETGKTSVSVQTTKGDPPAAQPSPQEPREALEPKTEILDSSATSGALSSDGHDPILDPPPFPKGTTTLVGGVIRSVDRIRNHLTVDIFGGGSWTVYFDERTNIFRSGAAVTQLALKKGERVYVDTMLDNNQHDIFARNIRVGVVAPPADADGQIADVDARHQQITLRDTINSASVRFAVDDNTRITHGSMPAAFRDLQPGSLVRVKFAADRPNRGLAREIMILAVPGAPFTFTGAVTFLDTHRGILSVRDIGDNKTYDISFTPVRGSVTDQLAVGAEVQVVTIFEGTKYTAQKIMVTRMAGAEPHH